MEISWGDLLPFLIALPGTIISIALLGWKIKGNQAEIADKEASTAERFVNAASTLVDKATEGMVSMEKRIKSLEGQMTAVSASFDEAKKNLKVLLSTVEWLISGIQMLSSQIRTEDGNDPVFQLDETRMKIVEDIRNFVNGKPTEAKPPLK